MSAPEMEAPTSRGRKDPVARFNTFEQPDPEIKAQIQHASRTQRALRAQANLWQSKQTALEEATAGLQPTSLLPPISKALEARPDSIVGPGESDRHSLDRTFSFNSLSTLQRDAEAARLSQWRDSPVSAFSPIDRCGHPNGDWKQEEQDHYPPLAVYKLKQSRKDTREQRKSIKKKEKEQKKAEKHRRRHSLANDDSAVKLPSSNAQNTSEAAFAPRRAISDPSFKASKDAAVHLVKRLASKQMIRLTRRSKAPQPGIPHVDDFLSKPDLQRYLDSELPEPDLPVAELPGPLPPYTPFQNSTANEDNCPITSDGPMLGQPSMHHAPAPPGGLYSEGAQPQRMMRCDNCQFGIKVGDEFFQCSICGNGDRYTCLSCDSAGESCRHELTKRQRKVLGYSDGLLDSTSYRHTPHSRHDPSTNSATFSTAEGIPRLPHSSVSCPRADSRAVHSSKSISREQQERKQLLDLKDLELRRREQDVVQKEREVHFLEREAALKERQRRMYEREAVAERRAQELEATARTRDEFSKQCSEMSTFLGTQFASLQAEMVRLSITAAKSTSRLTSAATLETEDDIDFDNDDNFRSHAGKRKASGRRKVGQNSSAESSAPLPPKPNIRRTLDDQDDDDDDEEESGTPKKIKQDPEMATSPGKLFACHFCKHNSLRYSEKNNSEKHYRGCSSGYWPDISRLKQHLYRVHWRNNHCEQCFGVFKKSQDLTRHRREGGCQAQECPFPEKFDDTKYNEIRKKRPTNTAEEVWYIMYDILFPGEAPPATPYADSGEVRTPSSLSPIIAPPQRWDALGDAFESRLNRYQDVPSQAWLRLPGTREFLREQLRASMADALKQMTPATTPAATPLPAETSPQSPNEQGSSGSPNATASPLTQSATSSRSTSSAQWRLPNHRRSFSRPLLPANSAEHSGIRPQRPTLTLETVTNSSEATFAVPTPEDPENDQYDDECGSWHRNDDSLGLAITTEDFDFEFQDPVPRELGLKDASEMSVENLALPPRTTQRSFEFRPVKMSSLADAPPIADQTTSKAPPMIDSAYGSLETNHGDGSGRPSRQHIKSTAPPRNKIGGVHDQLPNLDMGMDMSISEHEFDPEALEVNFQDFLGAAEMDECGNIGGRNLTEYLYGSS